MSVVGGEADYYPSDSTEAIAQLERLREGAGFLLFPATAFWWLEHYTEFEEHLESRYRKVANREVANREDACLICL